MKSLTTLYWISILFCFAVISCTSETDSSDVLLKIVSPSQQCAENEQLSMSLVADGKPVTASKWTASIGTIDNTGNWIAPSHIETDTQQATITATYSNQNTTVRIAVSKQAFKQPSVSYTQTIRPLLTNNCNFGGCHANGSRAGKVELSSYDSVLKSVIPYSADASKLYYSLIKTDPLRVMPPAGKLHADKIQSVWLWIEQGAINN